VKGKKINRKYVKSIALMDDRIPEQPKDNPPKQQQLQKLKKKKIQTSGTGKTRRLTDIRLIHSRHTSSAGAGANQGCGTLRTVCA